MEQKGGSVEARHFLATFSNYAGNKGDTLHDWELIGQHSVMNDERWIVAVLNLMEDEACTSQCLVMAYVTDTPSQHVDSYIIHTPADVG